MPWTIGADGSPEYVDETPDRVARPAPPTADSTLRPELENQTPKDERRVQLVNQAGDVFEVGESGAMTALEQDRGLRVATPDEVQRYDTRDEREGAIATLKGVGSTLVAGAADAALAPANLVDLATGGRGDASGRKFLESLVAFGAGERGAQEYSRDQRAWAEENPFSHAAAHMVGTALGGLGIGKAAGTLGEVVGLGRTGAAVATGAAEGASQNLAAAREEAYIKDSDLTGEQMIAAMGWGALVGGGVGLAVSKGGQLLFGRSGSRGSTPFDSPRIAGQLDDAARAPRELPKLDPDDVPHEAIFGRAEHMPDRVNLGAIDDVGLENAEYLRSGYRPQNLPGIREGAAQAKLPPVTVSVADDGTVSLVDGRHRMLVASERGEDSILAHVRQLNADGDVVATRLARVPILPRPAAGLGAVDDALLGGAGAAAPREGFGARFAQKLRGYSEERVTKAIGARGSDIAKLGKTAEKAEAEMRRMARDVLEGKLDDGTPIFHAVQSQDELVGNLVRAREEAGSALGAFREKVGTYIDNEAPSLRPRPADIADRIEAEVIAPLRGSVIPQVARRADDVQGVVDGLRSLGDDVSLEQLQGIRQELASVVYPKKVGPGLPPPPPASAAELQRAERLIEEHVEATIDKATTRMGGPDLGRYAELKAKFRSYREAAQIAGKADIQDLGNRVVSPTDYLSGIGGAAAGGPIAGAVTAMVHKTVREHSSSVLAVLADRLANTVDRKLVKGVDGFFVRALGQAAKARPANDVVAVAAPARSRAAMAAAVATPMALFLGKHEDKQKAYKARAAEVLEANANYGERIRNRSEATLGDLPVKAPKLAASLVTTATRGAQFLATKLPAPIVNAQSFTPRSSMLPVSDVELHKFARYWSAVASPMSVLDDFNRGRVSPEQVEAIKAVYPRLYTTIVTRVRTRLLELDQKGTFVPYQARLQLDLLLGMNGAGEPTASGAFIARFQGIKAASDAAGGQEPGPTPPQRPINIASRLRTGRDAFDPGAPKQ